MNLVPWQLWAGTGAVLIGLAGVAGFKAGSTFKQGEWDAAVLARKAGEDAALKAAAAAIAKIEVKSEKYIQPVRTEIRTNTFYRDCVHSADSLRNLNSLISGESPADGGVPEGNAAR